MVKHIPGTVYPVGTRYSNSETYDEATAEVVHGWQVFQQRRPDGSLTGCRSFIDNAGNLCGIEIAELKRGLAIQDSARDLLKAVQLLLQSAPARMTYRNAKEREAYKLARAAIAKASGSAS